MIRTEQRRGQTRDEEKRERCEQEKRSLFFFSKSSSRNHSQLWPLVWVRLVKRCEAVPTPAPRLSLSRERLDLEIPRQVTSSQIFDFSTRESTAILNLARDDGNVVRSQSGGIRAWSLVRRFRALLDGRERRRDTGGQEFRRAREQALVVVTVINVTRASK